jgi:hypothetical protein
MSSHIWTFSPILVNKWCFSKNCKSGCSDQQIVNFWNPIIDTPKILKHKVKQPRLTNTTESWNEYKEHCMMLKNTGFNWKTRLLNQRSTKVPNDQSNPSITPSHLTWGIDSKLTYPKLITHFWQCWLIRTTIAYFKYHSDAQVR